MMDILFSRSFLKLRDNITLDIEQKYFYNGVAVPRVTSIIDKMISEDYLMVWANKLGFKKQSYKAAVNKAAAIGTKAHNIIDRYLSGEDINDVEGQNYAFLSFKFWWDTVTKNRSVSILGKEESLVCQFFGGTYDLLLNINGKVYLVDFKTSNYMNYKYFLQLAAYRYMLFANKGIVIDGIIVLKLSKFEIEFEEYLLDLSIKEHYNFIEQCATAFSGLVYSYYQIHNVQNRYNEIFTEIE